MNSLSLKAIFSYFAIIGHISFRLGTVTTGAVTTIDSARESARVQAVWSAQHSPTREAKLRLWLSPAE
jgi:hypothetical protein